MKKIFIVITLLTLSNFIFAQKKPAKAPAQPSLAEMEKMMKAQGMSAEDMKMMKEIMNDPNIKKNAEKAQSKLMVSSLKDFVPKTKKNPLNKTLKTDAEVKTYVDELYAKLLKNGDAKQMTLANKIMTTAKSPFALTDAAQTAMFQGDLQTALSLSMKALQQDAKNQVSQNNVAALLTQLGYGENALPILLKINNTVVNNSTILNNLGFAYLDMGDLPKAYSYVRRATKVNPEHPQSRLCASALLEEAGQTAAAAEQVEIVNKHNNASIADNVSANPYKEIKMSWEEVKMKFTPFEYIKPGWRNTYYPDIVTLELEKYKEHNAKKFADGDMRKAFWKKILEIQKPLEKLTKEKYKESANMEGVMGMVKGMGDQEILAKSMVAFGTILNAFQDYRLNVLTPEFEKLKAFEDQIENNKPKPESCPHGGSHSTDAAQKACDRKRCNDYTPVIDNYRRSIMQSHNAKVIRFMEEVEEEHRMYTNLILTYFIISQSTAGMSKDEITLECLKFIEDHGDKLFRFDFSRDEMYYSMYNHTCDSRNTNYTPQQQPIMPLIPNFDCMVVFSFPSEFNEIKVNSKGVSAANNYGMNLEKIMSQANMSSAISLTNRIAEPGLNADPYTNVGNGALQMVTGSPNNSNQYKPTEQDQKATAAANKPLPKTSSVFSGTSDDDDEVVPLAPSKSEQYRREANAARAMLEDATDKSCSNNNGNTYKEKMKKANEARKKAEDDFRRAHELLVSQQEVYDQINNLRGDERDALIERFKEIQKAFGKDDNEIAKDVAEIERQYEVQRENRRQGRIKDWNDKINTIVKRLNSQSTANAAKTMEIVAKTHFDLFGKTFNYDEVCQRMGLQPVHREYFNSEGFQTSFNNGVTTARNNSLKAAGLFK